VGYEDNKRFDSAVVYYRRVMLEYPFSKYAEYLKPKMLFALQEKQTPQKATLLQQQQTVTNPNVKVLQDSVKNSSDTLKPGQPNTNIQKPPPKK
jgi:hypothetical protein